MLDDMGCQAGVKAANLTAVITEDKTKTTKSYDTIKLGIDAHASWVEEVKKEPHRRAPKGTRRYVSDGSVN